MFVGLVLFLQLRTLKRMDILMATVETLIADVNVFRADVTGALGRAQTKIDELKTALAGASLSPEQQASLDELDAAVNAADSVVKAFEPAPPAAEVPVAEAPATVDSDDIVP